MKTRAAFLILAIAAWTSPAFPDWRDVPDVKGVCSGGPCGPQSSGSSSRQREYVPPPPTRGSIAYGHGERGKRFGKAGNWSAAEQEYRAALGYDSSSYNGSIYWYELGYALLMQDRWSEAESALRRSIAVRPVYHYAHMNLAWVLLKLGREKEAEEEYLAAIRLDPGDQTGSQGALIALVDKRREDIDDKAFGRAFDLVGDSVQSEAAWRRYLLVNPGSSAAYNNLGVALRDQGRLLEADAAFREAARLNPENAKAKQNLAELKTREGYGEMLALAQAANFWGRLAAGDKNEAMKWMSMKCFDAGCSYDSDHSTAVRLLAPAKPSSKEPEPSPAVRNDPVIAGLQKEKQALDDKYKRSYEALKAVWDAKERGKGDRGTLDILEYQHKNDLTAQASAIRTAEIKIKERKDKLDLGVVLPGQ